MEPSELKMIITDEYIITAMEQNEKDNFQNILEMLYPLTDAALLPKGNFEIAETILETASILQGKFMLSEDIAKLLIDHLSTRIFLLDFIQMLLRRHRRFVDIKFERLDDDLLNAIEQAHRYNEVTCATIADLDIEQFISLCHYIVDHFKQDDNLLYDCRISRPLVHYVYDHEIIPRETLFMYLRLNLCRYEIAGFDDLINAMRDFFDVTDDGIPQ